MEPIPHLNSVVVIDNHVLITQAIESLVNTFSNFKVLYTCCDEKDLLNKLYDSKNIPDIILLNVDISNIDVFGLIKSIKEKYPNIRIVALSLEENENTISKMLQVDVCCYLLKDAGKSVLEIALKNVVAKGYYYTEKVYAVFRNLLNNKSIIATSELKERELEFMKHVCTEMTYKEISEKMFLSPKTVDGYRSTLFQKLNIKNRTGLVLYAIKNKIFHP
jgi:DNA-binding NarL/FixJ family response regulator